MNVFLFDYYTRLRAWHDLRNSLSQKTDLQHICTEVDSFWQWCPLSNHYLHPADIETWPGPWELINDNEYCYYARALGMIYTLLLLGVNGIDFVEATDYNNNDVVLVLVDNAKYVMNYWPNMVVNNNLSEFKVTKHINIDAIRRKIGNV
jgi:hypothetical protein